MFSRLGCELYIRGLQAKHAFKLLEAEKAEIERELGPLEWMELPEKQDARIVTYKHDVDIADQSSQAAAFEWLRQKAESFHKTFSPRIKALPIEDEPDSEVEDDRTSE